LQLNDAPIAHQTRFM